MLRAPPHLSVFNNSDVMVRFLESIYHEVVINRRKCLIDLQYVKHVAIGAALALVAEINRADMILPGMLSGRLPRDPLARSILRRVGFIEATSGQAPVIGSADDPVLLEPTSLHILKVRTGTADEASKTSFLDEFLRQIFPPPFLSDQVRGRLKGAVTEALLNIVDHAYEYPRTDLCPEKRWWICGMADRARKHCYFVVYDLGVGIPATVPTSRVDGVRAAFNLLEEEARKEDYRLIKAAVDAPRSRTGTAGRGRGLPEMRRLIDRVGDGMLWITSGRGNYLYELGASPQNGGRPIDGSLRGTLVVWRLKLTEALEGADGDYDDG